MWFWGSFMTTDSPPGCTIRAREGLFFSTKGINLFYLLRQGVKVGTKERTVALRAIFESSPAFSGRSRNRMDTAHPKGVFFVLQEPVWREPEDVGFSHLNCGCSPSIVRFRYSQRGKMVCWCSQLHIIFLLSGGHVCDGSARDPTQASINIQSRGGWEPCMLCPIYAAACPRLTFGK